MKWKLPVLAVIIAFSLSLTSVGTAHEYDRDDSDYALRYLAYPVHAAGMVVERLVLRPIHYLASKPGWDRWMGHEATEGDGDYFAWE